MSIVIPPTPIFTNWEPRPNWLILLPSRTAKEKGGIILPDTLTKKTNQGICIKAGLQIDEEIFLARECFFPTHSEFQILDSDTGYLVYVIEASKVLMVRTPPPEVQRFSREKGQGLTFDTITHDQEQKPN